MAVKVQQQRSLIDVVGASVLGVLVLGLALLFGNIFGSGGGRSIAIPVFILWALWHMVGSTKKVSRQCLSCGLKKE